jgi:hypothetical protein
MSERISSSRMFFFTPDVRHARVIVSSAARGEEIKPDRQQ